AWTFFRPFVNQYDAAVFALPNFSRRLGVPKYVIHPSIDPLSEKNRELAPREVAGVLRALAVPQDKPLLVQIGAFTSADDPLGVVNAYRLVKKHHDVRLVLAGTSGGEPDSLEILGELRETAQADPDVLVRELPPDASLQINALQRAATIVLQKSVRESFGLGAAEAMWKGKPVIGGFVGGLPQQIVYDVTGYTVSSVEGAGSRAALSRRAGGARQRGRGLLRRDARLARGGRAARRRRALRAARRRASGRAVPRRAGPRRGSARRVRGRARAEGARLRRARGRRRLRGPRLDPRPRGAHPRRQGRFRRPRLRAPPLGGHHHAPAAGAARARALRPPPAAALRRPAGALGAADRSPARAPEVELVGTRRERPLDHRRRHRRRLRGVGGVARAPHRALAHAHRRSAHHARRDAGGHLHAHGPPPGPLARGAGQRAAADDRDPAGAADRAAP